MEALPALQGRTEGLSSSRQVVELTLPLWLLVALFCCWTAAKARILMQQMPAQSNMHCTKVGDLAWVCNPAIALKAFLQN
jgi:hypothetical protein